MNRILSDLKNISFSNLNYKEIGLWPSVLRQLILIIVCIIFLFFGSRYVIENRTNFKSGAEAEILRLQEQIQAQYQLINQLPQYQTQVETLEKILQARFENISDQNQIGASIEEISRSGTQNDIVFQSITPGTPKEEPPFQSVPMAISFSGRYESIVRFLTQLSKTNILFAFDNFSIDASNQTSGETNISDPVLKATMICNIYWKASPVEKI